MNELISDYEHYLIIDAQRKVLAALRELQEINHNCAYSEAMDIEWRMLESVQQMLNDISDSLYRKSNIGG